MWETRARVACKSADKYGVSQAEAEQIFFNEPLLILPDAAHSQIEPRFHALGSTDDGRRLHVTFTLRDQGTIDPDYPALCSNRHQR
jgi:hypothetical protein